MGDKKVNSSQVAKMADVTTMTVVRWNNKDELHGELKRRAGGGYVYEFELQEVLDLLKIKKYNYSKKAEMYLRKANRIEKTLNDYRGGKNE